MKTFSYPSSSGGKPYTTVLHDDGLLSCDCRGYYIKRKDKPYSCRHTEDVAKRNGLNIVQRGEHTYAVAGDQKPEDVVPPPPVDFTGNLAQAMADGYVNPMLAQALTKGQDKDLSPFEKGYIWEEKWDGQRVILAVKDHNIKAWSRPRPGEGVLGHPRTLPKHLEEHAKALPDGTFDCEQIVIGDRSWAVSDLAKKAQQALVLFDVPLLVGENLQQVPIEIRRAMLAKVIGIVQSPYLLMSQEIEPGRAGVEAIWARGGEGAMLKRRGSLYRPGWRGPDWLKVKLWDYTTCVLTGFDTAKSGPHSVILFRMPNGVDSRCKTLGNKWLAEFDKNGDSYIGKRIVIKHQGLTDDGKPRHPQQDHFAGEGE